MIYVFTFGSDHTLPDDTKAWNRTVTVEVPDDDENLARRVFIGWLGSNKFSSVYTEDEFRQTSMALTSRVAYCLTVEAACDQCEYPQSQCRCIPEEDWWYALSHEEEQ
jgi:hypothetical protein